jgi:hypothetical protein
MFGVQGIGEIADNIFLQGDYIGVLQRMQY